MLRPVRITPPAVSPVSIDEARAHCRVDSDDDDAVISALIDAAVSHLDGWSGVLGRCLIHQDWRISFGDWPACRFMRLPLPDVSAAMVKYFDSDNVEQTVSASLFTSIEDERGTVVRFGDNLTFPSVYDDRSDGVRVEFTAGYGAAATDVPPAIRTAILLMVAHWYNNREASAEGPQSEIPFGVSALIAPFRRVGV
ncbi:MAG: head-tail connector protein [Rhizobiaceae bacterium]|nr:head-tail connector protein [Rhizobiaceae bacterium]